MNKFEVVSIFLSIFAFSSPVWSQDAPRPAAAEPLFAVVNAKPITQTDFNNAFVNYLRQKFYHGQVPEGQLAEARKEVGNQLVDAILLRDEAARRGLAADSERIAQTIAQYEARYASSEAWQQNRERLLPGLKQQLAEQDLQRQINAIGHVIEEPSEDMVRGFYDKRPELFTEPEKLGLHTILLKVDPSAPKSAWDAAREEAARIVARLRTGETTFEAAASLHSQDPSGEKGGNMGYLHRGMIPESVQKQIDQHPLGAVSDPVDLLEGIAVFRLDERIQPKLMAFGDVAARARELLKRELTNQAWSSFIAGLRKTAEIKIMDPSFSAGATASATAAKP